MLDGYSRDEFGIIHQLNPEPIEYDPEIVQKMTQALTEYKKMAARNKAI